MLHLYFQNYDIIIQLGYITFVNWRMSLLKKDRGKFSSIKNAFKNTIIVLFSFLIGILLDSFKANGSKLDEFHILLCLLLKPPYGADEQN